MGTLVKQKWRLDRLIGTGGMAAVYAATHRNGKRVAIKMLHEEHARNMDVRTRFLREGYLANAVDHDGVVSIVDDDVTEDGAIFLVMELLEGETLERRWERKAKRLPVVEVLSIANELLDVLAAAHGKELVHRDIKPENVFLTREGKVKILDFGIARLRQLSNPSTTQSGTTMGTPAFMSPEQARGRWDEVDERSDVWAVGATMFTLLTGRFVHQAGTPNEQLLAAMTSVAPPIGSILPELAPDVASVIDRALAQRVDERWESARAMQAAIHAAASAREPVRSSPSDPDKTEAMNALDAESVQTPTGEAIEAIEQGVANAPSAAPELRVFPRRRSPYVVGIGAGALGIAIALAALVHDPARFRSAAIAPAPVAAQVMGAPALAMEALPHPADQLAVSDTVARGGDAGLLALLPVQPAPPATGLPPSIPSAESPPRACTARRPLQWPRAPSAAPLRVPGAPARCRPEPSDQSEGLLDRRH